MTPDAAKAVQEAKAGKVEYRLDKTNIIHCPTGKVSFGADKLFENYSAHRRHHQGSSPLPRVSISVLAAASTMRARREDERQQTTVIFGGHRDTDFTAQLTGIFPTGSAWKPLEIHKVFLRGFALPAKICAEI